MLKIYQQEMAVLHTMKNFQAEILNQSTILIIITSGNIKTFDSFFYLETFNHFLLPFLFSHESNISPSQLFLRIIQNQQKNEMQAEFQKARAWRCQIQLPSSIDRMLTFEQIEIHNPERAQKPKKARGKDWTQYRPLGQTEQFMESFASLPLQEKYQEYCRVIGLIQKILRGQALMAPELVPQRYRFDAYIKDGIIRKSWQKCRIELNMANSVAYTVGREASSVDLHFYLMRRSKNKHRYAFALESIRMVIPRVVRIGFDKLQEVSLCFDVFRIATDKAHGENYYKELKPFLQQQQQVQQQPQYEPQVQQQLPPRQQLKSQNTVRQQTQQSQQSQQPQQYQQPQIMKVTKVTSPKSQFSSAATFSNPEQFIKQSVESPDSTKAQQQRQPQYQYQSPPSSSAPQQPSLKQNARLPQYYQKIPNPEAVSAYGLPSQPPNQKFSITSEPSIIDRLRSPSIPHQHNPDEPFFASISNIRQAGSITQPSVNSFRQSSSMVGNNGTSGGSAEDSMLGSDAEIVTLKRSCKNMYEKILPAINFEEICNSTNYATLKTAPTYQVMQHQKYKNKFKLILNISYPRGIVMDGLVDPSNYTLWNPEVEVGSTKIRLIELNTTICYEKHKAVGALEKPRQFVYSRHLFKKDGKIFMVDKTIESDLVPKSWDCVRGTINSCIWSAQQTVNGRMCQLLVQLDISQNGTMPQSSQLQANVKYLEGLARLDYFLIKQKMFITKIPDYFDVEWPFEKFSQQTQYKVVVNSPDMLAVHQQRASHQTSNLRVSGGERNLSAFSALKSSRERGGPVIQSQPTTQRMPVSSFELPVGDELFNQELSVINQDDFATAIGKEDFEDLQNRSIPHLSFQSMGSEDQPAISPVFSMSKHRKQSTKQESPHPPKITRKFTDELGNELEDELRSQGNYKQTDSRQFTQQLENLLAARESISYSAHKGSQLRRHFGSNILKHYNGDDQEQPENFTKEQHEIDERDLIASKSNTEINNNITYKFDPHTGHVIPSQSYLYKKTMMWPVTADYHPMTGSKNWKNFLQDNCWKVNSRGELVCIDQLKTREIQSVYRYLSKNLGDRTIVPKLPVGVLSSVSVLEHIAKGFTFMPYYLEQAAKESDSLKRFKLLVSQCLVASLLQIDLFTPFDVLAGQTFSAWLYGCPIYCQQIGSRKNMVAVLMVGRGYTVMAMLETKTELSQLGKISTRTGEYRVLFDNYTMGPIYFKTADCLMRGLTADEIKWGLINKAYIYDEKNSLYSQMKFRSEHRLDSIHGAIYRVVPTFIQQFKRNPRRPSPTPNDIAQQLCQIQGNWSQRMLIGQDQYFHIQRDKPCTLDYETSPLPSDSVYREDIVYKRRGDLARSQIEKQRLEEQDKSNNRMRTRYAVQPRYF